MIEGPNKVIKVLLVEENENDTRRLKDALSGIKGFDIKLDHKLSLRTSLEALVADKFDVVLLDLALPETRGMETINKIYDYLKAIPIILLTDVSEESIGVQAIQIGIHDYLVKDQISALTLERSILYAIDHHRKQTEIRSVLLLDELTKLYNRRGFFVLAHQQIDLARRKSKGFLLMVSDLMNYDEVKERFGNFEGDLALVTLAELFRKNLRGGDLVARIGGNEFAILALDARETSAGTIMARLHDQVAKYNSDKKNKYGLSASIGYSYFAPKDSFSLEDAITVADKMVSEKKIL
ncbi:MAG: GGDEF domain-containing response regulator [Candidatus Omnitrophica bacterium]|nr:GGDEF domain-containing response regulator [Candidatus Omnitrophota bacterium]